MQNKLWFKRKIYGWGWYPAAWQGWAVTVAYVGLVILFGLTVDDSSTIKEVFFTFLLPVSFVTITFIRICYKKGEPPKWQWGTSKDESPSEK